MKPIIYLVMATLLCAQLAQARTWRIPYIDGGLTGFALVDLDLNGMIDIVTLPDGIMSGPKVALNGIEGVPNRFAAVDVLSATLASAPGRGRYL